MKFKEIQHTISAMYANPEISVSNYLASEKLLEGIDDGIPEYVRRMKAAFLSSFTIQGLAEVLRARGVFDNLLIDVYTAPYNQFAQEILDDASGLYRFDPQLIYLILERRDILNEEHLKELLAVLEERTRAKIVLFNFADDYPDYAEEMRSANQRLRDWYRDGERIVVFDFDAFLRGIGKKDYWYTKYKTLGDFRLAPSAFPALAEVLAGYAIAVLGAAKKCAVLDLDNTLWQGIVGEDGAERILPDRELQEYILGLYERGVILAIASSNNLEDAMEAINQHQDMILRKDHFAAWRINWDPKDRNLAALAEELNIGTESMVFVDDDPFQQELIRASFPEVVVVPPDRFRAYCGFCAFTVTEEDRRRGVLYGEERRRKEFQRSFTNTEEYLRGLNLVVSVQAARGESLSRISQLTQKTNQFNLTTRRYSEAEIAAQIGEGRKVWSIRVADAFGDYGITGVCIVDPESDTWRIDVFLLSCRVMGRLVEAAFLSYMADQARKSGAARLIGEYIETKKNHPCAAFFPGSGFTLAGTQGNAQCYEFDLAREFPKPDFIDVAEEV